LIETYLIHPLIWMNSFLHRRRLA